MRLIRQFADAIARLVGLRKAGDHQAALDVANRLHDELLPMPRAMTDVIDTPSLASVLGSVEKIRAAAMLFWEEGHVYKAKGDPLTAFARYRRAHELFLEALALQPDPDDDAAILELSRVAPGRDLDARYQANADDD